MKKRYVLLLIVLISIMPVNKMKAQETNLITFMVGDCRVSTLSEGQQNGKSDILIGATPEILQKYAPDGSYPNATNAFLIRTPDKIVLVDAGFGRKLFDHLKELEVTPEQVDVVLITHMHGDHIGGLLRDDKVAFPNADFYLPQPEYDYWTTGDHPAQTRIIKAYKDKLKLFVPTELGDASKPLIPGIQGIAAYGHTPGHTGYLLESGKSRLLIWGDLTHAMSIQIPHPEVAVTYDVDPATAIESRKKILEYVAKNKIPVGGMHIAFPAIGHIKGQPGSYEFEPFCTCLAVF
jgi:glyoxylase-like metal-dependent hydrolase (beta-lactamase superfamily II)